MSVLIGDLILYGSATMPDDDTPTNIGGAIATTKKVVFTDISGATQIVSSAAGDTTQKINVFYRDLTGAIFNEENTLNGQTPVVLVATPERVLKALKDFTTSGDVAVEGPASRSNTAQAGTATTITLDAGASAVDDFYLGMVIRLTGGTGQFQIREIVRYEGSTKIATVNVAWGTNPDGTSMFRISPGLYFDKSPSEIFEVRRPFFNASADVPGGSTRTYFEKVFYKNTNGVTSLTSARLVEQSDPSGDITFGVTAALNDSTGNGGGNNRQVAPAGITFDSSDKDIVSGGTLASGDRQGVWLKLTLLAGSVSQNTSYKLRLRGSTT